MFVPPVRRHGVFLPAGLEPLVLGALAVGLTILAWAVFAPSPVSNGDPYRSVPLVSPTSMRSVAYVAPTAGADVLYVRRIDEEGPGSVVAAFPSSFNLHARASASPLGDSVGVLSLSPSTSPGARLSVVDLFSGGQREVAGSFDYLSPIAWSHDASRVALSRSTAADDAGRVLAAVLEVRAATGETREVARFENAFEVAPVGYSLDGERLFVVVIDQAGSALWVERAGRVQRVASLSPGRTRDWVLSPDGARLAFVDILGAGERSYAGRTLVIATGTISTATEPGDQLGSVWHPGSQVPAFGGPGGSVQLAGAADSYVIPAQWSPDGTTLVATIYSASSDQAGPRTQTIELVTPERRLLLSDQEGAAFAGWVRDRE